MKKTVDNKASGFNPDRPCEDSPQDQLNRSGLVENIAELLLLNPTRDSLVVAIQGPWGTGKSSFLNFLAKRLARDQVVILRFDPWWFSSADDLIVRFFHQLQGALGRVQDDKVKRIASAVSTVAKFVKPLASLVPAGSEVVQAIAGTADDFVGAADAAAADIFAIRLTIEEMLKEAGTTVIVLVDDIDRLYPQEIRDIFRLVKGISAIRGISYVLAFDRQIVGAALQDHGGEQYIDKIVQASVDLYPPSKAQLERMLVSELAPYLDEIDEGDWANFCSHVLAGQLTTFRHVKRLVNGFLSTYPPVEGEVDPLTFLGFQACRLLWSPIYNRLVTYCGALDEREVPIGFTRKSPAQFVLEIAPDSHKGQCENLLEQLFNRLPDDDLSSPSRNLLAYLSSAIDEGSVSHQQWKSLREDLHSGPSGLAKVLEENATNVKFRTALLDRLLTLVRERGLPPTVATNVITAVMAAGDKLCEQEGVGLFGDVSLTVEAILMFSLTQHCPREHVKIAERIVRDHGGPVVTARLVSAIEAEKPSAMGFSQAELAVFEPKIPAWKRTVVRKVKDAANNGHLWTYRKNLFSLLDTWMEWDSRGRGYRTWLKERCDLSPESFAEILTRGSNFSKVRTIEDWRPARTKIAFGEAELARFQRLTGWSRRTIVSKVKAARKVPDLPEPYADTLSRVFIALGS